MGLFSRSKKPNKGIELPSVASLELWIRSARVLCLNKLGRDADEGFIASFIFMALQGADLSKINAWVESSDEYKNRQAQPVPQEPAPAPTPTPRASRPLPLHVEGRFFVDANGKTFRPRFVSGLTLLTKSSEERRAFLQWASDAGFNGVRVFAGALKWAGQTAESARAALPSLMIEAAEFGLYVEVTAITDSREGGYDPWYHLSEVAIILNGYDNVLLEAANEPYHATQTSQVNDIDYLRSRCQQILANYRHPWAVGAAEHDEPHNGVYATHGGTFCTSHLDRSRDPLNQVRRVRELFAIVEATGVPVINNEPIGAAENPDPGKRLSDPYFFYALGMLNRGFEVGGVFHCSDGLFGKVPGPVQQACANSFVMGSIHEGDERLSYRNAGWPNSPVKDAHFEEEGGPIVRAYSFMYPDEATAMMVSLHKTAGEARDSITLADGWEFVTTTGSHPHVTVYRLKRK